MLAACCSTAERFILLGVPPTAQSIMAVKLCTPAQMHFLPLQRPHVFHNSQRAHPPFIFSSMFSFDLKSRAAVVKWRGLWLFQRGPQITAQDRLEVEVADPVDYVEEQEGGGEENPRVGIQLADVDVDASFPPAAFFTLLVAAEEALAVFPIQALVQAVVVVVLPEQGVAHGHHGPRCVTHGEG